MNSNLFDVKFNRVRPNDIVHVSCSYFGFSMEEVFTKSRKSEKVKVRQIIMYLMSKYTNMTLLSIADYFKHHGSIGNHATVIHSKTTVENLMEVDKDYKSHVIDIERVLGIDRRNYLTSRYFMNLKRGDTIMIGYETDEGIKRTKWRHLRVERKNGVLYAIGQTPEGDGMWRTHEDLIYQDKFNMCIGNYADELFIDES